VKLAGGGDRRREREGERERERERERFLNDIVNKRKIISLKKAKEP
jgi:hypothetical protein